MKRESIRQDIFCKEFIVDLNAKEAAVRSGYSAKTARQIGSKLLTKVDIRTRIAELMDERSKRTMVDADFVVRNLVEINARCQQKVPVMIFDPGNKAMVQKMEADKETGEGFGVWEFDSNGANRALELIGRHLAMFTDKAKVSLHMEQPLFPYNENKENVNF